MALIRVNQPHETSLVIPLPPSGVSGLDDDDDDVIYIAVGAAVGLLLVLAVIAIIIIIVCARSRRKKKSGKYVPDYVGYGRWFLCWVSGSVSILLTRMVGFFSLRAKDF